MYTYQRMCNWCSLHQALQLSTHNLLLVLLAAWSHQEWRAMSVLLPPPPLHHPLLFSLFSSSSSSLWAPGWTLWLHGKIPACSKYPLASTSPPDVGSSQSEPEKYFQFLWEYSNNRLDWALCHRNEYTKPSLVSFPDACYSTYTRIWEWD